MNTLINDCSKWSRDRNIIDGSTPKDQFVKLMEEAGELAASLARGKDVRDDLGDMVVIINNIALQHDTMLEECLTIAYDDIKDRKGKLLNGVFVKEADL